MSDTPITVPGIAAGLAYLAGRPVRRLPAGRRLLVGLVALPFALAGLQPAAADADKHKAVTVQDRLCRYDLRCWAERYIAEASRNCAEPVARLAGNPHRWTDTGTDPRFSHYKWKNLDSGIVTYLGDRLEVQNDFGRWRGYVYECDFDPARQSAIDARVTPGDL